MALDLGDIFDAANLVVSVVALCIYTKNARGNGRPR